MRVVAHTRNVIHFCLMSSSNGDEWYRLRSAVQQMMMRPKAVSVFLPSVNDVTADFVDRLKGIRDPRTGEVPNFTNEIMKWTFECKHEVFFATQFVWENLIT